MILNVLYVSPAYIAPVLYVSPAYSFISTLSIFFTNYLRNLNIKKSFSAVPLKIESILIHKYNMHYCRFVCESGV